MKVSSKNAIYAIACFTIAIAAAVIIAILIVNNSQKQKIIDEKVVYEKSIREENALFCSDISFDSFKRNLAIDDFNSTLNPKFYNDVNESCNGKKNNFLHSCLNRKINLLTEYQIKLDNFFKIKEEFYKYQYSRYLDKVSKECNTITKLPSKLTWLQLNKGFLVYEVVIFSYAQHIGNKIEKIIEEYDVNKSSY